MVLVILGGGSMLYPEAFFVQKKTETAVRFQERPTGQPSVSRLARGHSDFWISTFASTEKKKKKLILADWSAPSWWRYKLNDVKALCLQLMSSGSEESEDGFDLYIWKHDTIQKVTKDSLLHLISGYYLQSKTIPFNLDI